MVNPCSSSFNQEAPGRREIAKMATPAPAAAVSNHRAEPQRGREEEIRRSSVDLDEESSPFVSPALDHSTWATCYYRRRGAWSLAPERLALIGRTMVIEAGLKVAGSTGQPQNDSSWNFVGLGAQL